jgi:hypothetical protein
MYQSLVRAQLSGGDRAVDDFLRIDAGGRRAHNSPQPTDSGNRTTRKILSLGISNDPPEEELILTHPRWRRSPRIVDNHDLARPHETDKYSTEDQG